MGNAEAAETGAAARGMRTKAGVAYFTQADLACIKGALIAAHADPVLVSKVEAAIGPLPGKGAAARGRRPKLAPEQADAMAEDCAAGMTQRQLAIKYGVSPGTVRARLRERRGRGENRGSGGLRDA